MYDNDNNGFDLISLLYTLALIPISLLFGAVAALAVILIIFVLKHISIVDSAAVGYLAVNAVLSRSEAAEYSTEQAVLVLVCIAAVGIVVYAVMRTVDEIYWIVGLCSSIIFAQKILELVSGIEGVELSQRDSSLLLIACILVLLALHGYEYWKVCRKREKKESAACAL